MSPVAWLIFTVAAIFEVAGNATIRHGLSRRSLAIVATGMTALGLYGLVVNKVKWDFSKLLGVYVAFFALVSVLFGRLVFRETTPLSTWIGLGLIIMGGICIDAGKWPGQ